MKQFEITVKIVVSVMDDETIDEAIGIASIYADMAVKYKSVGADRILEVNVREVDPHPPKPRMEPTNEFVNL